MGKSKIVLLTVFKIYEDKTRSARIDTVPLGIYRSFNKRLTENIDYGIFRLLRNEEDALDCMNNNPDAWKSLYSGAAKCFDDDNFNSSSVSILNAKGFEEIFVQVSIVDLDNCENDTLSYWINMPKPNANYTKEQKKYEFLKPKDNNTHYTN